MCQPIALYQPIALPADFDGVDMIALAKTVTKPCSHCGHKHSGGVIVRDGGVICEHCGFNSQARVAAKLKHRRRAAAKAKRRRRAPATQRRRSPVPRLVIHATPRPRQHRSAPRGRDGGARDDGSGSGDDDGGGSGPPPPFAPASDSGRLA